MVARVEGGYAASSHFAPGEVLFFDQTGRLTRTVGRNGEGPGEYRRITNLHLGPGDSIWVYDRSSLRVSVLDPSGGFTRSFRVPVSAETGGMVVLPDRRVAFTGSIPRRGGEEQQVVLLFDPLGNPLPVPPLAGLGSTRDARGFFLLGESSGQRLWIVDAFEYRLILWDETSHGILGTLDLAGEMANLRARSGAFPPPVVTGVSDLGDGKLLIFIRMTSPSADLSLEAHGAPDLSGVFDTEIQLIDVPTGEIVARRWIPEFPAGPVGGSLFQINREAPDRYWIEILEVLPERQERVP